MLSIACSLMSGHGSGPGFRFGVRARAEMEIWCVKGMFRLKVVSSEKDLIRVRSDCPLWHFLMHRVV